MLSSQERHLWFVVNGHAKSSKTCKNCDMDYMVEPLCWFTAVAKRPFYVVGLKLCALRDCGKW